MPDYPDNTDPRPGAQLEQQTEPPDKAERGHALLEATEREDEGQKLEERLRSNRHLRIATFVSIAAAVVSIVSAGYSFLHGREQERHNKRIELTSMIEKLVSLQDSPNDQYFILGRLAARLIDELPDEVSPPEYSIVARSLLSSGNTPRAIEYGEKAVGKAESINDMTWALRQLGWTLTQSGAIEKGKQTYLRAVQIFQQKHLDEGSAWVKADKAYTYVDWGQSAAIVGYCDDARDARAKLAALMPAVIFPDDRRLLTEKTNTLEFYLVNCRQGEISATAAPERAPAPASR